MGNHPWDFKYKTDEIDKHAPYWMNASHLKEPEELSSTYMSLPPSSSPTLPMSRAQTSKSTSRTVFNDTDRKKVLSKYNASTINVCCKCHDVFLPIWRSIRNEFKRAQIPQKGGCILTAPFVAILEHFGLRLSSTEIGILIRSFRDPSGSIDVVRYDEFLRICLVAKAVKE